MSEQDKRLDRIEDDIKDLTKSTNENTIAVREMNAMMKNFIELTVKDIKETLKDHEKRIRANSMTIAQTVAVASVVSVVIGWVLRVVKF